MARGEWKAQSKGESQMVAQWMKIRGLKRLQQKKYFIRLRVSSPILYLLGPGSVMDRSLVLSSFLWLWNFPSPVKGKHDAMVNSHGFIRTNNSLFTHSPRAGWGDNSESWACWCMWSGDHDCFMGSVGGKEGTVSQRLWVIGVLLSCVMKLDWDLSWCWIFFDSFLISDF